MPKADVRIIIASIIIFFSVLLPIVQYQKWQRAVNYLKYATINNLGLKNGGTKETMELYRRAEERFHLQHKSNCNNEKYLSNLKMLKDPLFLTIVDDVVAEVEIEGGYKKPTFKDVFLIKLLVLPYSIFLWIKKKYRIAYAESELTEEECLQLTIDTVGIGTFESIFFTYLGSY